MWILIILLTVGGQGGVTISTIEFSDRENCMVAQARVIKTKVGYIDAFCSRRLE